MKDPEPPTREELISKAARLLAAREHSRTELLRKLVARGAEHSVANSAIDALQEQGLVSDRRFAELFARSRANRGYGPQKVSAELKHRGVDPQIIAETVDGEEIDWLDVLREQKDRRVAARRITSYREWAGCARALQQRGFSGEDVRQVLGEWSEYSSD